MTKEKGTKKFRAVIPLLILFMLFAGMTNACQVVFTEKSFSDNEKTSIVTPIFYYFLNCSDEYETIGTVSLNISSTSGNRTDNSTDANAITNNSENFITASAGMSYQSAGYTWNIVMINGSGTHLNTSTSRTLYITRLGSIEELIKEMPPMLNGIIPVIIPVATIILLFIVIGFLTGLFGSIEQKVKGGMKL